MFFEDNMNISQDQGEGSVRETDHREQESPPLFERKQSAFVAFLRSILRPGRLASASVHPDKILLKIGLRKFVVSIGDVEETAIDSNRSGKRCRMKIRTDKHNIRFSGISKANATAISDAIETERCNWWKRVFTERGSALRQAHEQITDPQEFITANAFRNIVSECEISAGDLAMRWPKSLPQIPEIRMLLDIFRFLEDANEPDARERINRIFVKNEMMRSKDLFDRVESRPLTEEQRKAVVTDERRNLVIAAAGSGKTSVIVAKSGWLVRRMKRKPSEILLLAFARDARKEMEERIRKRLGDRIADEMTVATFHSLGLQIIGEVEGKRPGLAASAGNDKALFDRIKEIVNEMLNSQDVSGKMHKWFEDYFAPYKSVHEFKNWGEYHDYIRKFDIRSLKGETVKSFEECEIANFLYLHGINYEYEASYKHDLSTSQKRQYKPDFYLPDHDLYIEHFGIDAEGNTASFVPKETYLQEMEWKREVHAKHETVLIETFSHEQTNGKLIRNLEEKLASHNVEISPIDKEKTFALLEKQGRVDPFARTMAVFLQHFKASGLSLFQIEQQINLVKDRQERRRMRKFIALFRIIFDRYQKALKQSGEIDFNDMIRSATELIEQGRYPSPFKYILIDEFQDISPGRAKLVKALLDSNPQARMFAVGDDWQAIYRFGGADIEVMRNFKGHFGEFERTHLATTFRCAQGIAKVATDFIMRNPAQISKTVEAVRKSTGPAIHMGLSNGNGKEQSLLKEALDRISQDAKLNEGTSEVLLLGRYRHLRPRNLKYLKEQYPGLRFTYMTIHRSKGLEADYVVVLGLCMGKYGFPVEIADDPLFNLVLATPETYPNAEERRLLYVALTRARRQAFLLAEGGPPSEFVMEMMSENTDIELFGRKPEKDISCRKCVGGRMERRENSRTKNSFYGCSSFPLCEHMERTCPKCGNGLPVRSGKSYICQSCGGSIEACPKCDGWLDLRMGKYGRFMGCSNYPVCTYTRNQYTNNRKNRLHPLRPHESNRETREICQ